MIEQIWETGFIAVDKTDTEPAKMGYRIDMQWHEDSKLHKESFEGTDPNAVMQMAFRFILSHYKKSNTLNN